MITSILFDFDGTIADTAPGIVKTMQETFREMNLPVPADSQVRPTIGIPLVKALQQLGNLTDAEAAHARDIYSRLFLVHEVAYTTLFPHVAETLAQLKAQGIRMAIVTSRDLGSLEMILHRFDIYDYFETKVTNNDGITPKPAPDMVLTLLERMNITADDTLVVGDTTYDIDMGNAANCHTCAVTYGNHTATQLKQSNPNSMIDNFSSLKTLIL